MDLFSEKNITRQNIIIFFVQASSAVGYAVFYSGLSIYLTQNKHYSHQASAILTGLFLSLNYLLPLVGGFMADKIITYKNLYYLGKTLSVMGCLLLLSGHYLHLSLALFLMGSLTNVCLNMFITRLFSSDQTNQRRIAFTWNYIGMNLGFLIGNSLVGFSTLANSYHYLFALMGCMSLLSLIITHFFIHEQPSMLALSFKNITLNSITVIFLLTFITFLFDYAAYIHSWWIMVSIFILAAVMFYGFNQSHAEEKQKLIQFMGFSAMTIVFWSVYFLTPVAIMQLINHHVQKNIFGITFAPQWFANIDSITILTISPLITLLIKRNSENNRKYLSHTSHYFSTSFFFTSIACALLFFGLNYLTIDEKIPALVIFAYLFAMTLGEIFIYSASSGLIGELIKEPLRGIMTGAGSLNLAIGGLISSAIASRFILPYIEDSHSIASQNNLYLGNVFLMISITLLVVACVGHFIAKTAKTAFITND